MTEIWNKIVHSRLVQRFAGFSVVGVISTLTSMVLTFLLNELFHLNVYLVYVIVYAITIFLSYELNAHWVFKSKFSFKALGAYYLTYLSSMILGLFVLRFYDWVFPTWNRTIISYMVIPVTMLYNFFIVSKFLK